jgi:hypothetical protein
MSKTKLLAPILFAALPGVFSCAENLKVYQRTNSFNNGIPLSAVSDDLLEMGKSRSVLYNGASGRADTLASTAKDSLCHLGPATWGERCYQVTIWRDSMHWAGDSLMHVWLRKN